jgi:dCTP deaminase
MIDLAEEDRTWYRSDVAEPDGAFVLEPNEFVLGCTVEVVQIPAGVQAVLDGKSSIGRVGVLVHATAGYIDPGFCGQVTLELRNLTPYPLVLYCGMRIGQLRFSDVVEAPDFADVVQQTYGRGGHYQGQMGATLSRVFAQIREDGIR